MIVLEALVMEEIVMLDIMVSVEPLRFVLRSLSCKRMSFVVGFLSLQYERFVVEDRLGVFFHSFFVFFLNVFDESCTARNMGKQRKRDNDAVSSIREALPKTVSLQDILQNKIAENQNPSDKFLFKTCSIQD